jgi:hypothetical protein
MSLGVPSGASKTFLRPWYVRHKWCTYLSSRLALSPNRPSFHLSLVTMEYHWVCPKPFLSRWYIWRELCTYLAPTLTLSPNGKNEIPHDPRHLGVPSGVSKMISEPMVRLAQTMHLSCTNTNTISKQKEERFPWLTSFMGSIRCVQNDFQAYGTFDTNRAPILRQD